MSAGVAPVLAVRGLDVRFPTDNGVVHAVDDLSFDLPAGRALGIVGESGSGKSAAALALLGLHRGTSAQVGGQVVVAGPDLVGTDLLSADDRRVRQLRGAHIAMIFQDPLSALDPFHTVGDQIAEVYRAHTGADRRAARTRAVEVLDQVHIPDPARRADAYPHQLSGGMRQRALIAMAVACRPRVIVADEPTTALDVTVQAQILDLLDELRRTTGTALVLISHDIGVIAGMADDVVVLHRGRTVEQGPATAVLCTPAADYTRELLAAVPRLDRAGPVPASPPVTREPLLSLTDVERHFPAPRGLSLRRPPPVRAVDGVTLDVRRGETLGIVGESGSGKTTLARMMVRLLAPTGGRITVDGVDLATTPERRLGALRGDLQMVFQDPFSSLNPRHTVGDSIADPLRVRGAATDHEVRRRVEELLEKVGLPPSTYGRYPHELSGGMRQRVGIARALAPRPRLVVCDEPVSALDVTTSAQILALLARLRDTDDLTLVFVSHDLAVIRQISDRVAVMRAGVVVELADSDTLYRHPSHPYTKELLAAVPSTDPRQGRRRP